jgi:predicted AlkP superfamily pyrophosphatase or phosphodiesterase
MKNYLNIGEMIDTEEKAELFRQTIENIKKLELDGDTAEVMLHEAGIIDEVFSFLIGQERYLTVEKVWSDIYKKDDLAHDNFDDYFNEQFLTEL